MQFSTAVDPIINSIKSLDIVKTVFFLLQIIVVTGGQVVLDRMSIPKLPLYGLSLAKRNNLAGQFEYSMWPHTSQPSLLQEVQSQELC